MSRLGNVAVFNGHPAESISGRCWRMRLENPDKRWWWRLTRAIDTAFFWELSHCRHAYLEDIQYAMQRIQKHGELNK